jgi:hypothetical protein
MITGYEYMLKLVPGIDYPTTMAEFNVMFSKEVDCENYILQMRAVLVQVLHQLMRGILQLLNFK